MWQRNYRKLSGISKDAKHRRKSPLRNKQKMNLADISPRKTDRAFFCGMTGSGKSTLAKIILSGYSRVYVIDGKEFDKDELQTWYQQGFVQVRTIKKFFELGNKIKNGFLEFPKIIYTPTGRELRDEETINKFFTFCYLRKNCVVYVDEVTSICSQYAIPDSYFDILTRGRSRNVMCFSATQRPANIPQEVFTESENCYIFFLNSENDRKRVEQNISVSRDEIQSLAKQEFVYFNLHEREHSGVLKLNL